MAEHTETVSLPYTPDQMFDLVSDISRYPEFIPWVKALRVRDAREEAGVHHCVGDAVVAFKGFTERFATTVAANPSAHQVDVGLVKGPFKHLANRWTMKQSATGGTDLVFHIDYEFNNFILQMLAKANFRLAVDRIMGAFVGEAQRRYG